MTNRNIAKATRISLKIRRGTVKRHRLSATPKFGAIEEVIHKNPIDYGSGTKSRRLRSAESTSNYVIVAGPRPIDHSTSLTPKLTPTSVASPFTKGTLRRTIVPTLYSP